MQFGFLLPGYWWHGQLLLGGCSMIVILVLCMGALMSGHAAWACLPMVGDFTGY